MIARRARPALGTICEVGADAPIDARAFEAAFLAIAQVERALSIFDPESDIFRFNAAPAGAARKITEETACVLRVAAELQRESAGRFDVTQGTGPNDWSINENGRLFKQSDSVRIDLGGIGKGFAVDRAFEALSAALGGAGCWVNAGGDLRVQGMELPVQLRDEESGGVRPWMTLREGAVATSYFGESARSRLAGGTRARHVSVAASTCLPPRVGHMRSACSTNPLRVRRRPHRRAAGLHVGQPRGPRLRARQGRRRRRRWWRQ